MSSSTASAPRAGRREWIGLAVILLPTLLYAMDLTVLHLAVPAISRDLAPTSAQLLWITDIYGFLVAGALLTMGTLGDRIGRRKVLLCGAAAFGAASVIAALSTSPEMLIAARAVQGLAGATLAPSAMALVSVLFTDEKQRTAALGVVMASFAAGAGLGPIIGGTLLEYRAPDAGRLDVPSAALSIAAILSAIWGVKELAIEGATSASLLAIAAG